MSTTPLQKPYRFHQVARLNTWGVYTLAVCGGLILAPLILTQYEYSVTKVFLATVLLSVCAYPSARYFANKEAGLPAFSVLCLAYAFQFALPIFTREPTLQLVYDQYAYIDHESVTAALLLSILGVVALQIGYYRSLTTSSTTGLPTIGLHLDEKKAVAYCVAVLLSIPLLAKAPNLLPQPLFVQLSALIKILQYQALVAVAIMGYLIYSGRGSIWYRAILYSIIGLSVLYGLSTAFIEQSVAPVAALLIVRWQLTRRLPVRSLIAGIAIVLFLSPVKHEYRKVVWAEDNTVDISSAGKALLWTRLASQYWVDTLGGRQTLVESTEQAASRTDLIHQFAHVCSITPSEIPYQNGATYSYFLVTMIPRVLWPEKPETGGANRFFGVNYGLTTEDGAEKTTFGISILAESYINFGWIGIVIIMSFQGLVLGILQHLFGEQKSGAGGQAVYVSFFVFFLNGVGTSAEILFGNIVQSLLFSCALLWIIRAKPSSSTTPGLE